MEGFGTVDLAGLSAEDAQVLSASARLLGRMGSGEVARLCDWRQRASEAHARIEEQREAARLARLGWFRDVEAMVHS